MLQLLTVVVSVHVHPQEAVHEVVVLGVQIGGHTVGLAYVLVVILQSVAVIVSVQVHPQEAVHEVVVLAAQETGPCGI
jgi:hypothetical protein